MNNIGQLETNPSSATALQKQHEQTNTIARIARIAFISMGIIFAGIAFSDLIIGLALPSPFLVLLGAAAFIALGILITPRPIEELVEPLTEQEEAAAHIAETFQIGQEELGKVLPMEYENYDQPVPYAMGPKGFCPPYPFAYGKIEPRLHWRQKVLTNDHITFQGKKEYRGSFALLMSGFSLPEPTDSFAHNLSKELTKNRPTFVGTFKSIKNVMEVDTDPSIFEKKLILALFFKQDLWIGNVGNGRAILFEQEKYTQLTCVSDQETRISRFSIRHINGLLILASSHFWRCFFPSVISEFINDKTNWHPSVLTQVFAQAVAKRSPAMNITFTIFRIFEADKIETPCPDMTQEIENEEKVVEALIALQKQKEEEEEITSPQPLSKLFHNPYSLEDEDAFSPQNLTEKLETS